jgi:hypothetical protein
MIFAAISKTCSSVIITLEVFAMFAMADYFLVGPNDLILESTKPFCSDFPFSSYASSFFSPLNACCTVVGYSKKSFSKAQF